MDTQNTEYDTILDSLKKIHIAAKSSRIAIRKDIKGLQSLMLLCIAVVLLVTQANKDDREGFVSKYGDTLMTLALTGAAGFKTFTAQAESEKEEPNDDDDEDATK
jgi:hypothetical protein